MTDYTVTQPVSIGSDGPLVDGGATQQAGRVMDRRKLLRRLARGALHNVRFADLVNLVQGFGFTLARVAGSHHVFVHPDLDELVSLQSVGGQAKPYQIRQLLRLVERYNLTLEE